MNTKHTTALVASAAIITLGLPLALSAPASASDATVRTGSCSGSATWKLKAKPDDGRIEVEAEVDSNRSGQSWAWRIGHNGSVSAHGHAMTRGASGSFSVERRVVNLSGRDTITFVARHAGETCRGVVRL